MLWNAVLQPLRLIAGLVSGIVVVNVLSKEGYGAIALLSAMASTLGLVVDFGVERSLVKFIPEIEARHGYAGVRRVLRLVVVQKLVVLAAILVLALIFREFFFQFWRGRVHEPTTLALLDRGRWFFFAALMLLVIFGALFDVYMQALVSYFRQRAWNVIVLLVTVAKPLLLALVALAGWGVPGVVAITVAIPIAATALAAWQAAGLREPVAEAPGAARENRPILRRFVNYSALSYWIQVTEYAYSLEFVLLVLPTAAEAAGFKTAYALVYQVLTGLWSPLTGVQIPLFARLHIRDNAYQLAEAYALLSKFLAALMFPAAIGLTLLSGNLLATLWPRYVEYTAVAQILTVALCVDAAISVPLAILMAYERFGPMLLARAFALLAIPILFYVAPRYGVTAAAVVMGGTRLATDSLAMLFATQRFPLRYPVAFASRVLLASGIMGAAIAPFALLALTPSPAISAPQRGLYLAGNLALGLGGAGIYLAAFRFFGGIDPRDRKRIIELRIPFATRLMRLFA